MSNKLITLLAALIAVLVVQLPAGAACAPGTLLFAVPPSTASYVIAKSLLGAGSSPPVVTSPPAHGGLSDAGSSLLYIPNAAFWSLGADSFSIRIGTAEKTVYLAAHVVREYGSHETFENPGAVIPLIEASAPGMFSLEQDARFLGSLGLRTIGIPGESVRFEMRPNNPSNPSNTGEYGSCTQTIWRPPPGGGGTTCSPVDSNCEVEGDAVLMTAGRDDAELYFEAWVRITAGSAFLRLVAPNHALSSATPWTPVSRQPHRLELAIFSPGQSDPTPSSSGQNRSAGAGLWVDDAQLLALPTPTANPLVAAEPVFRLGLQQCSGNPGQHDFDQAAAWFLNATAFTGCPQADDFESGQVGSGWASYQPEQLSIINTGTITGTYSARVTLGTAGDPTGSLLRKVVSSPNGHKALRFKVNASAVQLTPPTGALTLADGLNAAGQRAFRLQLATNASGAALLRATARLDDGSLPQLTYNLGSFATTRQLEVEWLTSPSTHGATGYLRIWADGVPVLSFTNVSNALQNLAEIRVGATSNPGNAAGSVVLDQVEMWGLTP